MVIGKVPNLRERAEGIKITYMCDNARKRVKIKIKKKGEHIGTCVAVCRYLSSQTYTPWPDTMQKN